MVLMAEATLTPGWEAPLCRTPRPSGSVSCPFQTSPAERGLSRAANTKYRGHSPVSRSILCKSGGTPVDCLWITLWRSGPHLWQQRDLLDTPRRHFRVSSGSGDAPDGSGIGQRVISG